VVPAWVRVLGMELVWLCTIAPDGTGARCLATMFCRGSLKNIRRLADKRVYG
jgi:hypothetical protein